MSHETSDGVLIAAPGTERPRRYRPKLRYELIGCGLHGHELPGTDAAELRPGDGLFAREAGGLRATVARSYVRVASSKKQVKDAFEIDTDGELAAEEEPGLFEHYGLACQPGTGGERRLAWR